MLTVNGLNKNIFLLAVCRSPKSSHIFKSPTSLYKFKHNLYMEVGRFLLRTLSSAEEASRKGQICWRFHLDEVAGVIKIYRQGAEGRLPGAGGRGE